MAKRAEEKKRRGPIGPRGEQGARGATGQTGPKGPKVNRADVLAMVDDQFLDIRKEMALQLARMAQIQVQLDQIYAMLKKLMRQSALS